MFDVKYTFYDNYGKQLPPTYLGESFGSWPVYYADQNKINIVSYFNSEYNKKFYLYKYFNYKICIGIWKDNSSKLNPLKKIKRELIFQRIKR